MTSTHKYGGTSPIWQDKMEFTIEDINDRIRFEIMDENVFSDDLLGMATLKITDIIAKDGNS